MDIKKKTIEQIKIMQIKQGIKSDAELARRCGWFPSAYNNRLARGGNFKISDLEMIAAALDCDLIIDFKKK